MSEENQELNPLDSLLEQYKERKIEIEKELTLAQSSTHQSKIIAQSAASFADQTVQNLQEEINNGLEASAVLEKLSGAFNQLVTFIEEQPLRIEKSVFGLSSSYKEIIGFENSIQQLKSQVVFEPILEDEDVDPEEYEELEEDDVIEEYLTEDDIVEEFIDYEDPPQAQLKKPRRARKTGTRPDSLKKTRNSKKKSK